MNADPKIIAETPSWPQSVPRSAAELVPSTDSAKLLLFPPSVTRREYPAPVREETYGYQELNPIARSWYLTGALELEGSLDPDQIIQAMMGMLVVEGSGMDIVKGWRYWLDAEAADDTRLTVGLQLTDSGEEITVRLRNSVLNAEKGIADDADAVVTVTMSQLTGSEGSQPPETVSGNPDALQQLVGYLDREIVGFHMHQR